MARTPSDDHWHLHVILSKSHWEPWMAARRLRTGATYIHSVIEALELLRARDERLAELVAAADE